MDITEKLPTVISFCSGYGGIERGLDLAGAKHRVLCYVEIEAFAIANLVSKMESGQLVPAPIYTDLKTFPAHLFRGCVDIITGGYPCQPFSAAGKRLGTEDPRHLWPFIRRHIESIRPVQCFFENVEGHISLGLREVIGDLEGAGYQATWGIFSAAEVGAPHQRKRVYIMANSNHSGQQSDQGQRQERHDLGWSGQELANSDSFRYDRRFISDEIRERAMEVETQCRPEFSRLRGETEGRGDELADTNSPGYDTRGIGAVEGWQKTVEGWRGHSQFGSSGRSEELADTVSEGSQGRLSGREDTERESQRGHLGRGGTALQRGQEQSWPPEPRLGRMVDGCPDRVDRIRLLGNGVVPHTAAKAWTTLNDRIKNEH